MSLEPPTYIPINTIAEHAIQYNWDSYDPYEPMEWPEEATKALLEKVSNKAITAFATGCAEWVVYRLSRHFSDHAPYDYLEAFWLFLMGIDRALPSETKEEDWQGPVRGAIDLSLMTVLNTVYQSEQGPPIQNAAFLPQIVLHVLPNPAPFLEWQDMVLDRLVRYFPRDEKSPDGPKVPRELLVPTIDLVPEQHDQLINAFIDRVDFDSNPLIRHVARSDSP